MYLFYYNYKIIFAEKLFGNKLQIYLHYTGSLVNITIRKRTIMDRKYNLFTLGAILSNRPNTLQWLRDIKLIPNEAYCTKHKKQMTLNESQLICGKVICQKKAPIIIHLR